MFTGIISEVGTVTQLSKIGGGMMITLDAPQTAKSLIKGGSVSINGACQSAVEIAGGRFSVLATAETVSRTNFAALNPQSRVNLELPLKLSDPLGGHLVSGHIDTTGTIVAMKPTDDSTLMTVSFAKEYARNLIEKGSVAIDGISLTVFDVSNDKFTVSLIPETVANTTLQNTAASRVVNLEFDMIGKYVDRFLSKENKGLTIDHLKKYGFMR